LIHNAVGRVLGICLFLASHWSSDEPEKAPCMHTTPALRVRARGIWKATWRKMSKGVHSLLLKTYRDAISMRREQQTSA
jgi:hypothetical protein